jgi:hypothetical protein
MEPTKPTEDSEPCPQGVFPDRLTANDRLFPEHREWATASIEWRRADWWAFASAYKAAADVLSKEAEASPSADDTLALPALFLYRHYLELQMKWLIRRAGQLVGSTNDFRVDHNLVDQWRECDRLLMEAIPQDITASAQQMRQVGRIIGEISKIDPESFAFRYPENKKRRPALPSDFTHVTMRNVREVMTKIDVLLSGAAECLEARAKFFSEWESFDPGVYEQPRWDEP